MAVSSDFTIPAFRRHVTIFSGHSNAEYANLAKSVKLFTGWKYRTMTLCKLGSVLDQYNWNRNRPTNFSEVSHRIYAVYITCPPVEALILGHGKTWPPQKAFFIMWRTHNDIFGAARESYYHFYRYKKHHQIYDGRWQKSSSVYEISNKGSCFHLPFVSITIQGHSRTMNCDFCVTREKMLVEQLLILTASLL
jgi:hypothetical protein